MAVERASPQQITFLTERGCAREDAARLSTVGAWELVKEIMQAEGTWKPYEPPKKKFKTKRHKPKRKPRIRRGSKMPFGKHKGKPMTEVPTDYLEWMLREFEDSPIRTAAKKEIATRNRAERRARRRTAPVVYKTKLDVVPDPSILAPWEDVL